MTETANGTEPVGPETARVVQCLNPGCPEFARIVPAGVTRCPGCGRVLRNNQEARTDGTRSKKFYRETVIRRRELTDQILRDYFADVPTGAYERALAEALAREQMRCVFIEHFLDENMPMTEHHPRFRPAYDKLTEHSERVVKLGERIVARATEMREARRGLPQGEQSDLAAMPDEKLAEYLDATAAKFAAAARELRARSPN